MKKLFTLFVILFINGWTDVFSQNFEMRVNDVVKTFPIDFRKHGLEIGADFPDLKFVDIDGDSVKFDNNKFYVVKFWFVGCSGCKQEEPNLKLLTDEFRDNKKIEFISLCMSKENNIKKYYEKNGKYGFKTISINRKQVEDQYKVRSSPTHFIIYNGKMIENFTFPVVNQKTLEWYVKRLNNLTAENLN